MRPLHSADYLSSCVGKRQYPDKPTALYTLGLIQNRNTGKKKRHVYRCEYCHFWHIGSFLRKHRKREAVKQRRKNWLFLLEDE